MQKRLEQLRLPILTSSGWMETQLNASLEIQTYVHQPSLSKFLFLFYSLGSCTVLDVPVGSTDVKVSEEVEDWNFLGKT